MPLESDCRRTYQRPFIEERVVQHDMKEPRKDVDIEAAVIFSECTVDMASDGKTGASVYGDENDNCSNIQKHLEAKGFTYMGGLADDTTDKTQDIMFAQPKYVETVKSCVNKWGETSYPKQGEEHCLHGKITDLLHA